MMIVPRSPIWDVIREPVETLNLLDCIFENIAKRDLKFRQRFNKFSAQMGFNFRV